MKNKTGTSLFLKRSKKYLFSGLAAVLPLALTFYVISLVLEISNSLIGDHINAFLTDRYGVRIPGLGFLLLVLSVFLAGVFVSNFAGERIFKFAENFFQGYLSYPEYILRLKNFQISCLKRTRKADLKKWCLWSIRLTGLIP